MGVTLLGVVLIFLSVGLNIQTAESCRCFPQHPQHQFCTSEMVILADITAKGGSVKDKNQLFRYKIKLIKVLKGSNNAKRIQYVYTNPQSSCGITLDQGRYVLSGYQFKYGIEVGMCDLVKRWDLLSLTEQENFKQTYKMGCDCTISTCFESPCCPQSKNECLWETNSPDSLEYACLRDSDGICSWYWPSSKVDEDAMCKA
ncbi:putative metalloproteinase inhibitor 2-like [Triplophysa rosa]|uniref:Metalloproteinase inhibitor 2-like n=2 Tax=Triplophysa rosa TaxID=992332 RepID=A0A9W7T1Z7_TRIRA|nr:putative metalloproteinase inhibitor 2-like [Triplophysa rosa]